MAVEWWSAAADLAGAGAGQGACESSGGRLPVVRKERLSWDSLRLYKPEHFDTNLCDLVAIVVGCLVPTRRELIEARRRAREAKRAAKRAEEAAQKAAEDRLLAEFLLNRDDQIRAEKDKLDLEIAAWQRQNEAN